jgi:hypothetical protein
MGSEPLASRNLLIGSGRLILWEGEKREKSSVFAMGWSDRLTVIETATGSAASLRETAKWAGWLVGG